MRVCLLASGSKGNSLFIEAGDTRLLVDAGLSSAELVRRLDGIGVTPADLHALFITHEHIDHVRGAVTLARRGGFPIYATQGTLAAMNGGSGKVVLNELDPSLPLQFRDLEIQPFLITHDAAEPVGYLVRSSAGNIGVATDLGIATRLVRNRLAGCRILVVESNHDEQMLQDGPYPWHLKQRIRSRHGHLSNAEAADLLDEVAHGELAAVLLAHLSEVNNAPDLALAATGQLLEHGNRCSAQIVIGCQSSVSTVVTL